MRKWLCSFFVVFVLLFAVGAPISHAAPVTTAGTFSIAQIALDNDPSTGHSLLLGSRTINASPYHVEFTVTDVRDAGCFNAWFTMLHTSQAHNDAFRMFCDHLLLVAHNNGVASASAPYPFSISPGVSHTMLLQVDGQQLSVYCVDPGPTYELMASYTDPAPNVASGASVVAYAAGGTDVLFTDVSGAPGLLAA